MKPLEDATESKIAECWAVVNRAAGKEAARAHEWRSLNKNKKSWVLQRAGFDVEFCNKPLHAMSVSERLKIRRSIEQTIKELEKVKALMCFA